MKEVGFTVMSLIELFRMNDGHDLDRVCIFDTNFNLTRRELILEVYRTAFGLKSLGFSRGSVFGIATPNCFEAIILCLAMDVIGGKVVLLDPALGLEGLKEQLDRFRCEGVLVPGRDFDYVPFYNALVEDERDSSRQGARKFKGPLSCPGDYYEKEKVRWENKTIEFCQYAFENLSLVNVIVVARPEFDFQAVFRNLDKPELPAREFMQRISGLHFRILTAVDLSMLGRKENDEAQYSLRLPYLDKSSRVAKFYVSLGEEEADYLGFSDFAILSALKMKVQTKNTDANFQDHSGGVLCVRPMWTVLGFKEVVLNLIAGNLVILYNGYSIEHHEAYCRFRASRLSLSPMMAELFCHISSRYPMMFDDFSTLRELNVSCSGLETSRFLSKYYKDWAGALIYELRNFFYFEDRLRAHVGFCLDIPLIFGIGSYNDGTPATNSCYNDGTSKDNTCLGMMLPGVDYKIIASDGMEAKEGECGNLLVRSASMACDFSYVLEFVAFSRKNISTFRGKRYVNTHIQIMRSRDGLLFLRF